LQAIEEIDTSAYLEKAIDLALKKNKLLDSEKNMQIKKVKIFRYLLQKGFDTETVYKCWAQLTALKNEQ
jgi:SOS response regulatory protein OraA/RecX